MEIYLTKIILNPRSNRVRSEVGNPQELHRTISRAFPPIENPPDAKHHVRKTPRNQYNILYRLDIDRHRGKAFLLVQSEHKPDWSFLETDYSDELETKNVGENYEAIESGMNLIFRLQANPTKRIGKSDQKADDKFKPAGSKNIRRRVELRTDEERTDWLVRQGERLGFQIANLQIEPAVRNVMSAKEEKISFTKKGKNNPITYGSVVFEGVLQVTDADKFRESMVNGIGQGKAYGFGLLSVAPAK
ncbi:MAG: type I-E CRISPR-associated protein Cas6/Cse3/CasE [Acidobacteriota bacterium]|nr:type I-E CRISPR-associated protein Cas6/Cse3/CasE [Acidobacteriota bacterium]